MEVPCSTAQGEVSLKFSFLQLLHSLLWEPELWKTTEHRKQLRSLNLTWLIVFPQMSRTSLGSPALRYMVCGRAVPISASLANTKWPSGYQSQ